MRRITPLVIAAAIGAGCGGSPGDLIEIRSSGGPAQREQRIVVRSDGRSTCNGGPAQDIGSDALIEAREIEREMTDLAERAAVYESPRGEAANYVARTKDGTVRWQEGGPDLPGVLPQTQLFALQQGRKLC